MMFVIHRKHIYGPKGMLLVWLYIFICRWCLYLTGNMPISLQVLLRGWLLLFVCRWCSYLTGSISMDLKACCWDSFTLITLLQYEQDSNSLERLAGYKQPGRKSPTTFMLRLTISWVIKQRESVWQVLTVSLTTSTLKMEDIFSSKTSFDFQVEWMPVYVTWSVFFNGKACLRI
jgi:hypothetical protein